MRIYKSIEQVLNKVDETKEEYEANVLRKFDREIWDYLDESKRLKTLNDMAGICAKEYGLNYKVKVRYAKDHEMGREFLGWFSAFSNNGYKGEVVLNRTTIGNGRNYIKNSNKVIKDPINNMRSLDTLFHEMRHAKQVKDAYYVRDKENEEYLYEKTLGWNLDTKRNVNGKMISPYIAPYNGTEKSYNLYLLQPAEYDAFTSSKDTMLKLSRILNVNADADLINDINLFRDRSLKSLKNIENEFCKMHLVTDPTLEIYFCIQYCYDISKDKINDEIFQDYIFYAEKTYKNRKKEIDKCITGEMRKEKENDHDR